MCAGEGAVVSICKHKIDDGFAGVRVLQHLGSDGSIVRCVLVKGQLSIVVNICKVDEGCVGLQGL